MLVTRTETYTDWVYSSAHANETAATVGRGLMVGHIYFRYSYDMLKEGDTVSREVSHVHLSDGSTYELGSGLSSEKIDITFSGLTGDGHVYLEVNGKKGIGVSSITRNITIEYDDGKVPVLDTEQLDGVLNELSKELTASMVDTANAIKAEVMEKVETVRIEAVQESKEHVESVRVALVQEIDSAKAESTSHSESIKQELLRKTDEVKRALEGSLEGAVTEIKGTLSEHRDYANDTVHMTLGSIGRYTIHANTDNNLLYASPDFREGNVKFEYVSANKTIRVKDGLSPRNRILRVTYKSTWEIQDAMANGFLFFRLVNPADNNRIMAQTVVPFARPSGFDENSAEMQISLELFLPTGSHNHPAITGGIQLKVHNASEHSVVMQSGGVMSLLLISA